MSFFFQAEDGIRDSMVTGVQTCALPIFALALMLDATQRMSAADENSNEQCAEQRDDCI